MFVYMSRTKPYNTVRSRGLDGSDCLPAGRGSLESGAGRIYTQSKLSQPVQ